MTVWKSFGASVIGPSHTSTGRPNQDALAAFHYSWGDGIVVSDGLGSKLFSNFGSHAACLAVARAVHACKGKIGIERDFLANQIKENWLSLISPLGFNDCAATCLFAFRMDGRVLLVGMLGDGLAAVVKSDGSVVSLFNDKADGFSNITSGLSPDVIEKDWRWLSIPESDISSVVLCTDGVADDLMDANGFVKEFASAYCELPSMSALRCAREMLENWPTPKHSDDKTIACLFREKAADD